MNRFSSFLVAVGLLVGFSGVAEAKPPYARGRALFIDKCVGCHSVGWKQPARHKAKTQFGPDLTRILEKKDEAKLAAWIRSAVLESSETNCRARVLDDHQVRDIVFFLKVRRFDRPKKPVLIEGLGVGAPAHSSVTTTAQTGGAMNGPGVVKSDGKGSSSQAPQGGMPPDPKAVKDRAQQQKGSR